MSLPNTFEKGKKGCFQKGRSHHLCPFSSYLSDNPNTANLHNFTNKSQNKTLINVIQFLCNRHECHNLEMLLGWGKTSPLIQCTQNWAIESNWSLTDPMT